ncbi:MAG: nuclear transport factor 2 family protein [Thermomicrobiales bacterium]
MEQTEASEWVERYTRAWEGNDPREIGDLFTDDALYYTAPFREPWRGRDEIVAGWLDRKDEPGRWQFTYEVLAIAGDLGFVQGRTIYSDPPMSYANLWVICLGPGGRCRQFTEWWMEEN